MPTENESNNSLIPSWSNGLIRVQHSIEITNKILKERNDRLVESDYESVKIGNQIWMAKNLNVDRFRNGDLIPEIKSDEDWKRAGEERKPAWCYYDNDVQNGMIHGKLYNWFAVNDSRGIAPEGWRVPSNEDWQELILYLGGETSGKKMKVIDSWSKEDNNTNESGFSALPSGFRYYYAKFSFLGSYTIWWSSFSKNDRLAGDCSLDNGRDFLGTSAGSKESGFSIRCIKDVK